LFWALLASGQINMRKVDGWQTLATTTIDQPIDYLSQNHVVDQGTQPGTQLRLTAHAEAAADNVASYFAWGCFQDFS
jgi:hypothetical protein